MTNFHNPRGFDDYMYTTLKRNKLKREGKGMITPGGFYYPIDPQLEGVNSMGELEWSEWLYNTHRELPAPRQPRAIGPAKEVKVTQIIKKPKKKA